MSSSKSVISQIEDSLKVPRVASLQKKTTINYGCVRLPCGEVVGKNHKCLVVSGSIEEAIGLIGKLKANHFNLEDTNARKMFIFARLTKIQEDLLGIIRSIITTPAIPAKHTSSRFNMDKIRELDDAITALNSQVYTGTPGATIIESDIYYIWTIVRRCERQIYIAKDPSIGVVVEESVVVYLSRLCTYFSMLITYISQRF